MLQGRVQKLKIRYYNYMVLDFSDILLLITDYVFMCKYLTSFYATRKNIFLVPLRLDIIELILFAQDHLY